MSRARKLLNDMEEKLQPNSPCFEAVGLSHYGEVCAVEIQDALWRKLDSLDYENIGVEVFLDLEEGVFVTFWDEEGDEITYHFYVAMAEPGSEQVRPIATVVSDDDDQIDVDLTMLEPPIVEVQGVSFIDLTDLRWMNKSTVKTLLAAGSVDDVLGESMEGSSGTDMHWGLATSKPHEYHSTKDKARAVRGGRKVRLPLVVKRKGKIPKDDVEVKCCNDPMLDLALGQHKKFSKRFLGVGAEE